MFAQLDTRNVIDEFKGMENEQIRQILHDRSFDFAFAMSHVQGDFNLSTVLRNANAFGAREAFYFGGKRQWDRRGSVGVHNYTFFQHLKTIDELQALKEKYTFVGIDNVANSESMYNFEWPKNPLMIFGEEGCGLSEEILNMCSRIVMIPQYGSVRSLNVGTASGIVMNDFVSKLHGKV